MQHAFVRCLPLRTQYLLAAADGEQTGGGRQPALARGTLPCCMLHTLRAAVLLVLHSLLCRSITSLYVGGVTPDITEDDLKDAFYTYGEIAGVRKVGSRFCAFVTFAERSAAEAAAEGLANKLIVKGIRLRLMWGRPQQGRQQQQLEHDPMQPIPSGAGGGAAAAAGGGGGGGGGDYFGLQQQPAAMSYPSMDPTAMGARIPVKRPGEGGEDDSSKRQRAAAAPTGYGAPPPQGGVPPGYGLMPHPPQGVMPPMQMGGPRPLPPGGMQMPPMPHMGMPMQMPPPGYGGFPPHMGMQQMRPPGIPPPHMMGGPPMGMPPPGDVRPPPAAAGAAAVPPPRPPMQQQQQPPQQQQQQQQAAA
jgi:pre-mRNA-splicing factor RBM22/SLT11